MTDQLRQAWIDSARERLQNLSPNASADISNIELDTIYTIVEHLLERVRRIEAREGID